MLIEVYDDESTGPSCNVCLKETSVKLLVAQLCGVAIPQDCCPVCMGKVVLKLFDTAEHLSMRSTPGIRAIRYEDPLYGKEERTVCTACDWQSEGRIPSSELWSC